MDWKTMSRHEALIHLRRYDQNGGVPSSVYERLDGEYRELRGRMREVFESVEERRKVDKLPRDYATDLFCGLALHEFLESHGFGMWQAADDNVWRYIAIFAISDIVHERLGGGFLEKKDAFSGVRSSRFWVKNIWWYVYLSLVVSSSGTIDYQKTESILRRNDTDILAGVVDHQGRGFRVALFRKMMSMFDEFCQSGRLICSREDVFRYLIKEYQIRTAVVDPDLEGIETFLKEIFIRGIHLKRRTA